MPSPSVHGLGDKLVPYTNSLQLMEKMQSPDKALYLINDGHSITDQTIISHLLDSLCHKNAEDDERPINDVIVQTAPNWSVFASEPRSSEEIALRHS